MAKFNLTSTSSTSCLLTKSLLLSILLAGLAGCVTAPPPPPPKPPVHHQPPVAAPHPKDPTTAQPEFGYPPLSPQILPAPQTPPAPPQPQVALRDGHDIPLVQTLMAQGEQQLKQGQLDDAEETFVRVQRIAPQLSSVYARLSEVALRKKDGVTAEGMARRGLVLSRSPQQKAGFWQLIELAANLQNKPAVAAEARQHLQNP